MKFLPKTAAILCLFFTVTFAEAGDAVLGAVSTFESWYGVPERCVRISPLPGAHYDNGDIKDEMDLCEIDFYSSEVALCPKIWSTSAAMVIYDISSGRFEEERLRFQQLVCSGGKIAKYVAKGELGKLKFALNQSTVLSGFSSPILYYHFSRYFDMSTIVPVAVWRSIDTRVLLGEVALGGIIYTEDSNALLAINTAWHRLVGIIEDPLRNVQPSKYGNPEDILTTDGQKAHGSLLDASGRSYGPELDPTIASPWTADNYLELQKTPTFTALASDAPLDVAIRFSLYDGSSDVTEEDEQIASVKARQLAFSMRDLIDVLLIDFIMSQRDRLGNIDYKPYYYWTNNGLVARSKAKDKFPGDGDIPEDAVLILRMMINDNDAAGRYNWDDQTVLLRLLERLHHFDANTYRLLMELNADLQSGGAINMWLINSLGFDESKVLLIADNTALAAEILRANCEDGTLRFDLDPEQFFAYGYASEEVQACSLDNSPRWDASDTTIPSEE